MGRKFILTESQVKRLVENLDEEAAGYDDFDVMYQHGGKSMAALIDTLSDLSGVFRGIINMTSSNNIEYVDLKENLETAVDLISEIIRVMRVVFKDFTERNTIRKGEILHRKLESYQEKIRMMINMGEELLSKEHIIDKLNELTENVSKYLFDYATELQTSHARIGSRLDKYKPTRKPDMN